MKNTNEWAKLGALSNYSNSTNIHEDPFIFGTWNYDMSSFHPSINTNSITFKTFDCIRGDGRYKNLVVLLYFTNQRAKDLVVLFRVVLY